MPDTVVQPVVGYGQRAHLAEVFPHHVQRTAPDEGTIVVGRDPELLHGLVQDDALLAEQNSALNERFDECLDARDVCGAGGAHGKTHQSSLGMTRTHPTATTVVQDFLPERPVLPRGM